MTFKLDELGGHAFYREPPTKDSTIPKKGWYFISERGQSKGATFGPWATSESALEWGPAHAACSGVELATRRREENHGNGGLT